MSSGFGIDTAFQSAVEVWRELLADRHSVMGLELHGDHNALVPARLVVRRGSQTTSIDEIDWPRGLPRTLEMLRTDARVWELFSTEWSMDELREYVGLDESSSPEHLRDSFVGSSWWEEFEAMVEQAFLYEWRHALEQLAGPKPNGLKRVVARPEPVDRSLADFEGWLRAAALQFEATYADARLLYREPSRVVGFVHLSTPDHP